MIGAGIAGLACARRLAARGAKVTVFEQHRRPGGRAGTHPTAFGGFDHGAPYFSVQSQAFDNVVDRWHKAGAVNRWHGRVVELAGDRVSDRTAAAARYIGSDGMQSLARYLASGLDLRLDVRIERVARRGSTWTVTDDTERSPAPGGFDAVVIAVPAPSAAPLLTEASALMRRAAAVSFEPRWVALLAVEAASGFDFAAAEVTDHEVLGCALRDSAKQPDAARERWVLQATPRWSRLNLNVHAEQAAGKLAQAFAERFNFGFRPALLSGYRWLLAEATQPLGEPYLWDDQSRIGAVGDWCTGSRIPDAYASGDALAAALRA